MRPFLAEKLKIIPRAAAKVTKSLSQRFLNVVGVKGYLYVAQSMVSGLEKLQKMTTACFTEGMARGGEAGAGAGGVMREYGIYG